MINLIDDTDDDDHDTDDDGHDTHHDDVDVDDKKMIYLSNWFLIHFFSTEEMYAEKNMPGFPHCKVKKSASASLSVHANIITSLKMHMTSNLNTRLIASVIIYVCSLFCCYGWSYVLKWCTPGAKKYGTFCI